MNERFHWTSPDGVEITLPRMSQIKAGVIRRHRKEEPVDFIFSVLEELDVPDELAKVDELDTDALNKLVEAWQSAVAPGESSRSSN